MYRIIFTLFFLNFVVGLTAAQQSLKVISYNIWNGFDHGKDLERRSQMISWLNNEDADVIAFQELNNFTQESLETFAKLIGHSYAVILKEEGFPIGLTSKQPIKLKSKMLGGFWHGLLHVETYGIDFVVVHLSPHDWRFRKRETNLILDYIKGSIQEPGQKRFMVLGDFNAHSPFDVSFDRLNPEVLAFHRNHDAERYAEKGGEAYQSLRMGNYDYSVMASFLSLPLIDVVEKFTSENARYSFPAPVIQDDPLKESMDGLHRRLDYIMVSPALELFCISAEIANTGTTTRLSDHYPAIATFDFAQPKQ
ncbi:endonuclease/exonuclease/phosphatase family protein [Lunatimonas salinarum]|uniref:endonuclease/exonuclease/phosphatase family protein n=1 Tax=Lunatimonas salinarum TaxID=1774590 RepID=UPI001ADEF131|nr:endonuclease/exonuclease/phosphatase family protein [Lunatimonas salinarum]